MVWLTATMATDYNELVKMLSKEQLDQYKKTFALCDRNGDGKISIRDLGFVMRTFCYQELSVDELMAMIKEVDDDRSGSIDFPEFLAVVVKHTKPTDMDDFFEAFQQIDTDGDGFISADEVIAALATVGERLNKEEVVAALREADIDGDGQVDYEEFARVMRAKKPC